MIGRLNQIVRQGLATPDLQRNLSALGLSPFESSSAQFKTFVAAQVRFYAELVRLAKIERQ